MIYECAKCKNRHNCVENKEQYEKTCEIINTVARGIDRLPDCHSFYGITVRCDYWEEDEKMDECIRCCDPGEKTFSRYDLKGEQTMKRKIMISQPMNGRTNKEIQKERDEIAIALENKGYEVVDSFFAEEKANEENLKDLGVKNNPVWFMSKAIEAMSFCDAVFFVRGWQNARGCRIEHEIAVAYGLEIYEE